MLKKSDQKQSEDLLSNARWEEFFKKEFPKAYLQQKQNPTDQENRWWRRYWEMMLLCRYPSIGNVNVILDSAI
jgi:hypothetical protein